MWIVFKFKKQRFVMQFSGKESLNDIKKILSEVYGFSDKITFQRDQQLSKNSFDKPIKDLIDKDYDVITVNDIDNNQNEKFNLSGPVSLEKYISIGFEEIPEKLISERSSSKRRSSISLGDKK